MSASENHVLLSTFRAPRIFQMAFAAGCSLVSMASCAPYGTTCLRNSDCASGEICVNGSCQSENGQGASDAAWVETATSPVDASVAPKVDVSVSPMNVPDASARDDVTLANDVETGAAPLSVDTSDAPRESDAVHSPDARDAADAKSDTLSAEDSDAD